MNSQSSTDDGETDAAGDREGMPLGYRSEVEYSAELMRMALPQMARHGSSMNPLNYALWYTYVSGAVPKLVEDTQQQLKLRDPLAHGQVRQLFDQHLNEYNVEAVMRVRGDLVGVMDDMARSTHASRKQAEAFEGALQEHIVGLRRDGSRESLAATVDQLLQDTRAMRHNVDGLQNQLSQAVSEVTRLKSELERTREESLRDPLTGIANRRALDLALEAALAQPATKPERGCCLLLLDIDHFKRINDTYGHMLGDRVLVAIARILRRLVTPGQTAARYGGEEFAIVMPNATRGEARMLAERVRVDIARGRVTRRDSDEAIGQVTVSIGVCVPPTEADPQHYLRTADEALYASKSSGRNGVTIFPHACSVGPSHLRPA